MYNANVYSGADGTLTISEPTGFPGEELQRYFGESGQVGRVQDVSVAVSTVVRPFHELGSALPRELRSGNVTIAGSVGRAYVNGALLRLMLGPLATDEEREPVRLPTFNMTLILDNLLPAGDAGNSVLTVYGVMFDTWQLTVPEDDFVLERLTFRARRVAVRDVEVGT